MMRRQVLLRIRTRLRPRPRRILRSIRRIRGSVGNSSILTRRRCIRRHLLRILHRILLLRCHRIYILHKVDNLLTQGGHQI